MQKINIKGIENIKDPNLVSELTYWVEQEGLIVEVIHTKQIEITTSKMVNQFVISGLGFFGFKVDEVKMWKDETGIQFPKNQSVVTVKFYRRA